MNIQTSYPLAQKPATTTTTIARQSELLYSGNSVPSARGSSAQNSKLAGAQPLNASGRGQIVNLIV